MKKVLTILVAYSFVYITSLQLFVNILFVFKKDFYLKYAFYFTQISGLSISYLLPMVAVAFLLKFCKVSRICAIAQIIMSVLWLIIQEDNIYNITSQIIIGVLALLFTLKKITS